MFATFLVTVLLMTSLVMVFLLAVPTGDERRERRKMSGLRYGTIAALALAAVAAIAASPLPT